MAYVLQGRWGLNREGAFQDDPWFLAEKAGVVESGFGRPPQGHRIRKLPDGVVLPGLVNSHTHTELSYLKDKGAGQNGVHGFALGMMKEPQPEMPRVLEAARAEVEKARQRGTFFFADISNNPDYMLSFQEGLQEPGFQFHGVRFLELLGFRHPNDQRRLVMAQDFLKGFLKNEGKNEGTNKDKNEGGALEGIYITPHSIYGSSPDILRFVQGANHKIASLHVLEDSGEIDVFSGTGPTAEFLRTIGQYADHPEFAGQNIISYLSQYCQGFEKLLLVHLCFADQTTLGQIGSSLPQSAMVLCHRSNIFLGYRRSNWGALAKSPLPLLLGTDSAATCPDLSILDEVLALLAEGVLPAPLLLKAATWTAYDYFGILPQDVPWFVYPGSTPDVASLAGVGAVNVVDAVGG